MSSRHQRGSSLSSTTSNPWARYRCAAARSSLKGWVGGQDCLHPDDSGYEKVTEAFLEVLPAP
jgi:hypothetical protein